MKKNHRKSSLFIACLFTIAIFTISCGGGGGGGGEASAPSTVTYSGLTTQATVFQGNATTLSEGAYSGGIFAAEMGSSISGVISQPKEKRSEFSLPLQLPQIFENSLDKINWKFENILTKAIISENDTIPGNCGGSASYSIMRDDQTGDFTGQFVYNNYCEDTIIFSGGIGFSGRRDINTLKFTTFNFYFDTLTITDVNFSGTIKGDIHYSVSGSIATVTENILLKNNTANKVYWCKDYSLTIIKEFNYRDFTLSGTYYDPDHGYVTISTFVPFRVFTGYSTPSTGALIFTGSGNTLVLLTALTSSTYRIYADTNGDTYFEWDSGVLYW